MKILRWNAIASMAAALALLAAPAAAVTTLEGVAFDPIHEDADGVRLRLSGVGLLRYMVVIKAYVGALYLEEGTPLDNVLSDRAKRLEVEYFHAISGKDFGPATIEGISRNVDAETLDRLMPKIEYHNSLYADVKPGDRYALTYIPGRGTELTLNGQRRGIIEGAEFAAALFSIWLGPNPVSSSFKSALLGRDG